MTVRLHGFMWPTPQDHRKIVTWARARGVPINTRRLCMGYRGGPNAHVAGSKHFRMDDVTHEIAHWLVAPPERRLLTNFGLGADPDLMYVPELAIHEATAQVEEEIASLVGISILHLLFADAVRTETALRHHDWFAEFSSPKKVAKRFVAAKKHAWVDDDIRKALDEVQRMHADLWKDPFAPKETAS